MLDLQESKIQVFVLLLFFRFLLLFQFLWVFGLIARL